MKLKKMLSLFLIIIVVMGVMSGCGKETNIPDSTEGDKVNQTDSYVVKVYGPFNGNTEDCELISEEISKITRELINCDVELVRDVNKEQLNLALISGEKLDLFYAFPWEVSLSFMASSNQILPIDDLMENNASEIKGLISEEDWKCVSIDGAIYGIPMNKDKAQGRGFMFDKGIADEIGIDYSKPMTFDQLEKELVKVKEAYPDMYPVVPNGGTMIFPTWACDSLGDELGVLENCLDDCTEIVNLFDTDTFKEYCSYMYKWTQEGLMMPDSVNTTEGYDVFINSGVGFGTFTSYKAGFEAEETRKCGKEIAVVEIDKPHSVTTMVNAAWCIAGNSENPDKAMQLLNLMYTNPEVSNLFINGVEGVHWQFADENKNIIQYADGIDASTTGYQVCGWAWPNEQITYPWQGDDPDIWENLGEFNVSAKPSPAKWFVWNNETVINDVTACNNVIAKYKEGLITGCLNPDEAIPKMNEELKNAGIDNIIQEKQAQLDEWLNQ